MVIAVYLLKHNNQHHLYLQDLMPESSYPQKQDEWKGRITELLTTLEKVKRNSELRQQQSDDLVVDLKKSNG